MELFSNIIAGISGGDGDAKLIAYLNFLAGIIRIEQIIHLHIIKMLYNFGNINRIVNEDLQLMAAKIKEERLLPLLKDYGNVKKLTAKVLIGKVIPEFDATLTAEKAGLIALGKKKKGSCTLAKNIIRKLDCETLIIPSGSGHQLKNILVAVDLSEHSSRLLEYALAIQKEIASDVAISCLHAYELIDIPAYTMLHTKERVRRDTKETVEQAFDNFVKKHQTPDSAVNTVLIEESNSWPSHYILQYINDVNNAVDLLIMGTQGHTRIAALLGSTVEKVISKNNRCPMLIIK